MSVERTGPLSAGTGVLVARDSEEVTKAIGEADESAGEAGLGPDSGEVRGECVAGGGTC